MFKYILGALLTWPIWIALRLSTIILGFFVVPVVLLFRTENPIFNLDKQIYPERKLWKGMTFRPIQKLRDNSQYEVNQ